MGVLCRPLLSISRVRLHAYAQQQAMRWVEDASNQSTEFDRNFLRHSILPPVIRRWPQFAEATLRSAQLCGEQEQVLDELLQPLLQQWMDPQGALAIEEIKQCSEVKRQALLRRWFRQLGAPIPSRQQLLQLWSQVALSRQAANPQQQLGDWQVRRYRQRLYLVPPLAPLPALWEWHDLDRALSLPAGLGGVWLQSSHQPLPESAHLASWIRPPDPGERMTWRFGLSGRVRIAGRGSRPLKKIYQEQGIPPWLRPRLPVLCYDEVAVTIPGLFVTEAGVPDLIRAGKLLIWQSELVPFLQKVRSTS
jgi:tRNA(Ile)-lysidine synthase